MEREQFPRMVEMIAGEVHTELHHPRSLLDAPPDKARPAHQSRREKHFDGESGGNIENMTVARTELFASERRVQQGSNGCQVRSVYKKKEENGMRSERSEMVRSV